MVAALTLVLLTTAFVHYLIDDDLNYIKEMTNIGTSINNTYISFSSNAIRDMAGNLIVAIPFNNATMAADHTPDGAPPLFENFTLGLEHRITSVDIF